VAFSVSIRGIGVEKFHKPVSGIEVLSLCGLNDKPVVAWHVNGYLRPLTWTIDDHCEVDFVDTSSFEGMAVYRNTLSFLLVVACRKILGKEVFIRHSISDGFFCEVQGEGLDQKDLRLVREALESFVHDDLPIKMEVVPLDRAKQIFRSQNDLGKAALLEAARIDPVTLWSCDGVYGHFYTPLAPSAGYIKSWDLVPFRSGVVLRFPTVTSPKELPPFRPPRKLADVFEEYAEWLDILGVSTMDNLHRYVASGRAQELILVSEALHNQKLNEIAGDIIERGTVKVICIAGPSGSGKTTTAKRLAICLRVCGKRPVVISLGDYFLDREKTPRDADGNFDFESIYALDLDFLEQQLDAILAGKEVVLPRFNFISGKREKGPTLKLEKQGVVIIEGIHGLNQLITRGIPDEKVYKIFVSPLTGISMDRHNRTSTTDNRLLRRLVRDYRTRGKSAEATLMQWPSVVKGAQDYIFPYQEKADRMFNSALVYELPVLKGYTEGLLRSVEESSPVYGEAQRLLTLSQYFPFIPSDVVPNTSILREFIGGSCFE